MKNSELLLSISPDGSLSFPDNQSSKPYGEKSDSAKLLCWLKIPPRKFLKRRKSPRKKKNLKKKEVEEISAEDAMAK